MKANILGHEYEVAEEEGMFFNTGNYGKHNYMKLLISYDPDISKSVKDECILHELIEAINYWVNVKLEHHQIAILSAALFSVLRNNPELTEELFKGETHA
jgi:hypothetical protein